jgi:hypothetical protein
LESTNQGCRTFLRRLTRVPVLCVGVEQAVRLPPAPSGSVRANRRIITAQRVASSRSSRCLTISPFAAVTAAIFRLPVVVLNAEAGVESVDKTI